MMMNHTLELLLLPVPPALHQATWLAFLVEMALKGTLVLIAAMAVSIALGRASAAVRHLVWTAALGALLVLPLLSLALPAWRVALPPPATIVATPGRVASGHVQALVLPRPTAKSLAKVRLSPAETTPVFATWPTWTLLAWMVGFVFVLTRRALGTARVEWLVRRATKVEGTDVRDRIRALARQMGLRRTVTVFQSDAVAMPMTCGVVHPAILLPATAGAWPRERLRIVLAHELAHIQRHDCLTQALAQLACAAYWFHPLAWAAARHQRHEREHASDDRVLGLGTQAADYAGHLVELARSLQPQRTTWAAAVAMAQPSNLEARVRAVLDPAANRRGLTRRAGVLTVLALATVVLPLAALQASAKKDTGKIWGTVYDPSGAVVPDATVTITNQESKVKQSVSTSQEGVYEFPAIPAGHYDLEVAHRGFGFLRRSALDLKPDAALRLDVILEPGRVTETVDVVAKSSHLATTEGKKPPRVPHRIRVGGDLQAANLISQVKPVYPEEAQEKGIEGTVLMNAVISLEGNVLSLEVINDPDPALAQAAVEAVKQWHYRPTLLNGEPIEVVTTITVNFRLEE
ncbi:MAG TPA: M56 family metallopeptidase [Terriglobia bacterium]|nr:M56 family metallopeptidase [Terriglobia bacterium]